MPEERREANGSWGRVRRPSKQHGGFLGTEILFRNLGQLGERVGVPRSLEEMVAKEALGLVAVAGAKLRCCEVDDQLRLPGRRGGVGERLEVHRSS
jgi:hypothetical protein